MYYFWLGKDAEDFNDPLTLSEIIALRAAFAGWDRAKEYTEKYREEIWK